MTLKEICNILNIEEKMPVHELTIIEYDKEQMIIGTWCWPMEMIEDLENNRYDSSKRYNKAEVGIYFPHNITIEKFFDLQAAKNREGVNRILDLVYHSLVNNRSKQALYYSIYCILHELGHWKYYQYCRTELKLNDVQIYCNERAERNLLDNLKNEILKMDINDSERNIMFKNYNTKYHEIQSEKAADQYAIEHFPEALECVKEHFAF